MCTWDEIDNGQAQPVGCPLESERVWSSSICLASPLKVPNSYLFFMFFMFYEFNNCSNQVFTQSSTPYGKAINPKRCTETNPSSSSFSSLAVVCCADQANRVFSTKSSLELLASSSLWSGKDNSVAVADGLKDGKCAGTVSEV